MKQMSLSFAEKAVFPTLKQFEISIHASAAHPDKMAKSFPFSGGKCNSNLFHICHVAVANSKSGINTRKLQLVGC